MGLWYSPDVDDDACVPGGSWCCWFTSGSTLSATSLLSRCVWGSSSDGMMIMILRTCCGEHAQQAQLRWIHVESTSWPDVVSTLIFGSVWKLNQRLVFHVDSTSFFPLWFHMFSTLNPRVFNVESTWCFPRWINVRTPHGFHVDIWFYMKVDSMSSFQRWIYVMFSTLNPHNIFN